MTVETNLWQEIIYKSIISKFKNGSCTNRLKIIVEEYAEQFLLKN